jgi:hypothetical protein
MLRHEAITPDIEVLAQGVFGKQVEEENAVGVGVEYILACVAALGDVMGDGGDDDTGTSGHIYWRVSDGEESSHGKVGRRLLSPV